MAILFTLLLALLHITFGKIVPSPSTRHEGGSCPIQCICFNQTVACNSLHLKQVPIDLPARTKVLFLNDNVIWNVDFSRLSKLKELEELHLKGNQLLGISRRDVQLLPKLRAIDLSDNPIVCDCELSKIVNRTLGGVSELRGTIGDTLCALPVQYAGKMARDVLSHPLCRHLTHRQRRHPEGCHSNFCHNGGRCYEDDDEPVCECPTEYEGPQCRRPTTTPHVHGSWNSETLTVFLEDVTLYSIKVSWRIARGFTVRKYLLSLSYVEDPDGSRSKNIWTNNTHYSFFGLQPNTGYEVCVEAFETLQNPIAKVCEHAYTHLPPSRPGPGPGPEPEPHPGSERPNPNKGDKYQDDDIIHQAAVILGSIIGVCAFFIIFLTLVYKFRTLSNTRVRSSRSSTPRQDADTEAPQVPANPTNPGREIIVLSVSPPEVSTASLPDETGALAQEPIPDAASSVPDSATINSVLQALQQQGSRTQQDSGSPSTVVLYRPENSATHEGGATSQDNPSGNAPIFIVADGNHYPLDPTLSEVLRSAMSKRTSIPRDPLPNEPPPPYSERAEDHHPTPTPPESTREASLAQNENCQQDNVYLVEEEVSL